MRGTQLANEKCEISWFADLGSAHFSTGTLDLGNK